MRQLDRLATWVREHAPAPSTNRLVVGAIVVSVLVLSISAATLAVTVSGRADDRAREENARITACRSSLSVRLVTGPTAKALKALALEGADSASFLEAATASDPDEFDRLTLLSDTDPAEFLAQCAEIVRSPP